MFTIYALCNPSYQKESMRYRFYVGRTRKDPITRLGSHLANLDDNHPGDAEKCQVIMEIFAETDRSPIIEVLETDVTESLGFLREEYWTKHYFSPFMTGRIANRLRRDGYQSPKPEVLADKYEWHHVNWIRLNAKRHLSDEIFASIIQDRLSIKMKPETVYQILANEIWPDPSWDPIYLDYTRTMSDLYYENQKS